MTCSSRSFRLLPETGRDRYSYKYALINHRSYSEPASWQSQRRDRIEEIMIVWLSSLPLVQNDYSRPNKDSLIYVGNNPFRRLEGHIAPSEHYIHKLAEEHHIVVGTDFKSGLELASSVKSAALWIIEVMLTTEWLPQQLKEETAYGLAAGRHLSQMILKNTNSQIVLLAMPQPTSPAILNNLEEELGDRGIVENALAWPPNDFAELVRTILEDKTI